MAVGLPPILRPEGRAVALPHRETEIAGTRDPTAVSGHREVVDAVVEKRRHELLRQPRRHSVQGKPPFKLAVDAGQVQVIPLGRTEVEALNCDALAELLRGKGEVVADPLPPADRAATEIDSIQIVVPVHRVEHGKGTTRSHRNVANMRSETLFGRRQ